MTDSPELVGRETTGAPRPRPRFRFIALGLLLAVGLGVGLFSTLGTGASTGRPKPGGAAPTFSLPRVGGSGQVGTPSTGGGDGHPAVLLFFASWCGPCQGEVPALAKTVSRQVKRGGRLSRVVVIGVDSADPINGVSFVHKSGVSFPVANDLNLEVTNGLYYFTGDPEAVYIYGDGTIAGITYGPTTPSQLVSWEQRLTAASAPD
jgi:thiol-disulfide isomerase/thioredoxin